VPPEYGTPNPRGGTLPPGGGVHDQGMGVGVMDGAPTSRRTHRQKAQAKAQRAKGLDCWLCGQPIDYTLPPEDVMAFSVDHIKPWSTHPELREDPGNLASAHSRCNKQRGANPPPLGLGLTSRAW
jgi:5-methylcytosine-specific restriction endonuclease McrA